jgi:hypothetical protein
MDTFENPIKEMWIKMKASHESLMAMMRANYEKIIGSQESLTAMMRTGSEEMRATVSTFRSAQDQHEESGNKTQGTR